MILPSLLRRILDTNMVRYLKMRHKVSSILRCRFLLLQEAPIPNGHISQVKVFNLHKSTHKEVEYKQ